MMNAGFIGRGTPAAAHRSVPLTSTHAPMANQQEKAQQAVLQDGCSVRMCIVIT